MIKICLPETASTNTYLKELCAAGDAHGAVVYTWNQLSGYGRHGRYWYSNGAENIAVSIALKPPCNADFAPFSIVAGVAVARTLAVHAELDIGIKWPNDILLDGHKLCGISCERISFNHGVYFVVGIGINVNNTQFPDELAATATSLRISTDREWDAVRLLDDIVDSMFQYYNMLANDGFAPVLADFKRLCVNLGQPCVIIRENEQIHGTALDIDDTGCLVLQKNCGKLETFASGEISLRGIDGGYYATGS